MSGARAEPTLDTRVEEHPGFDAGALNQVRLGGMALRFAAGALTSVCAGGVTLLFGPRIGGILLAFPAILVASLTLIEQDDGVEEAREDARGAMAGGAAMTLFALVAALLFGHLPGALVLALAALTWVTVAFGLYRLLWWRG